MSNSEVPIERLFPDSVEAADHEASRIMNDVSACIHVGAHCVRTGRQHLDAAHGGEPPT